MPTGPRKPLTVLPVTPENHPGLRRAVRRGANGKGYSVKSVRNPGAYKKKPSHFRVRDAAPRKNLPRQEKVKDVVHFPGRDSARNGARSFRDRCACPQAAIIGREQTEYVMRKSPIYFALCLMLLTQKLAKTNEGKRLPSPGTS